MTERKKHTRLEKEFYSEQNFKLLEDVLLNMVDKSKLNKDYKVFIFNNMEKTYNENEIPPLVNNQDIKNYLKILNKNVLSIIASQINKKELTPAPSQQIGSKIDTPFAIFPESNAKNRELQTFYGRNFTAPLHNPVLHPEKQIESFPPPQQDRTFNNTKMMFSKIEEERKMENVKPAFEFPLPVNTKDENKIQEKRENVKPAFDLSYKNENKFQEMMKNRENDDLHIEKAHFKDSYNSIVDGLDENLLKVDEVIDKPENEKTVYLTISSKYRDTSIYPSPTHFTLETETNTIYLSDEILFKENRVNVDFTLNNIISIECLDVVIPKSDFILQEPYLWLCINEIGTSNIGTGVPNGAFARLKPMPVDKNSPYITLRPHLLERQILTKINDKLTFRILTSDGEPFEIEDKVEIKVNSNKLEIKNTDIKENDLLYLYSIQNEVIGFYPKVYIHSLSVAKNIMTLRLFLDKENDSDNKISKFIDKNTKIRIIASKYLSVGDFLFLESDKEKNKYKIIDIKDDIISLEYKSVKPKKITKIGFIKQGIGYQSNNKEDINYKGGVLVKDVKKVDDKMIISLKNNYNINNNYFLLQRNKQVNYMFRITYL